MKCESNKTDVPSLLAEKLSPGGHKESLHHMQGCTKCRREKREFEKIWMLMDQWKIQRPSAQVKSRLMAAVREEFQCIHMPWWARLLRSFTFQTVVGALGLSVVIYLILPYHKAVNLCEINFLNAGALAVFPKGLLYFMLGLLYGFVPIAISEICFARYAEEVAMIKGLETGAILAAFLIPFYFVQCTQFTSGLMIIMALGLVAGSLSGGTGTLWVLSRTKMEV